MIKRNYLMIVEKNKEKRQVVCSPKSLFPLSKSRKKKLYDDMYAYLDKLIGGPIGTAELIKFERTELEYVPSQPIEEKDDVIEVGSIVTYAWKISVNQQGRIVKKLKSGLYQIEHIPSGEIERIPKWAIKEID